MAVMLTTSVGDLVIDLFTDLCPLATKNFLKLCKIKYYNNCLFHSVQKDFIVQTGDPTGTGSGGDSIFKFLYGDQARFFDDEVHPQLKHDKVGIVAMASAGENANASQFYITTRTELDYLDGKHTVFGEVGEGLETLMRINEAFVDEKHRPYKNIRIKHTIILDDPFDDPAGLADLIPDKSPELKPPAEGEEVRLEDDWVPMDDNMEPEELEKSLRKKEAQSRAVVLEMIGDLPEADMKPPENVLFVCKLNPVTEEGDLELIFGRFGKVMSADIIRDFKTGDSLCYAFIEFESQESCEAAYFKMDNVLIDDRRIHVDFSQSVSHLWNRYRKLGTKGGDGQFANYGPGQQGKGRGCFKCGEVGHFAKECPNNGAEKEEGRPEKPKYSIKDTGGQRGNTSKRYDMVFDGDEDAQGPTSADKRKEGRGGSAKELTRNDGENRKGGSGDRGGGCGYYPERDDERSRQERRQERDRRTEKDFERPHQERDRDRSRDGGGHSRSSGRPHERREMAEDDDSRMSGRDSRGRASSGRASNWDSERSRPDGRHTTETEKPRQDSRQGKEFERSRREVSGDSDFDRAREDFRMQRGVEESKRRKESEDYRREREHESLRRRREEDCGRKRESSRSVGRNNGRNDGQNESKPRGQRRVADLGEERYRRPKREVSQDPEDTASPAGDLSGKEDEIVEERPKARSQVAVAVAKEETDSKESDQDERRQARRLESYDLKGKKRISQDGRHGSPEHPRETRRANRQEQGRATDEELGRARNDMQHGKDDESEDDDLGRPRDGRRSRQQGQPTNEEVRKRGGANGSKVKQEQEPHAARIDRGGKNTEREEELDHNRAGSLERPVDSRAKSDHKRDPNERVGRDRDTRFRDGGERRDQRRGGSVGEGSEERGRKSWYDHQGKKFGRDDAREVNGGRVKRARGLSDDERDEQREELRKIRKKAHREPLSPGERSYQDADNGRTDREHGRDREEDDAHGRKRRHR